MNRRAAIAAHSRSCGESVRKWNNPTCLLHPSPLPKTKRTRIPSQVLLANMPQKQLKALHGEAILAVIMMQPHRFQSTWWTGHLSLGACAVVGVETTGGIPQRIVLVNANSMKAEAD